MFDIVHELAINRKNTLIVFTVPKQEVISTLLGRLLLTAKPISISVPRSPGPQVTPFLFQSIVGSFNLGLFLVECIFDSATLILNFLCICKFLNRTQFENRQGPK